MISTVLAVAFGGALGSVLRYGISHWALQRLGAQAYLGTLLINLIGCLLIGFLAGWFVTRGDVPAELRLGLISGLLGGFTTFSAFSLEGLRLLESGRLLEALGYVLASVLGGLMAAWGGLLLARMAS